MNGGNQSRLDALQRNYSISLIITFYSLRVWKFCPALEFDFTYT